LNEERDELPHVDLAVFFLNTVNRASKRTQILLQQSAKFLQEINGGLPVPASPGKPRKQVFLKISNIVLSVYNITWIIKVNLHKKTLLLKQKTISKG